MKLNNQKVNITTLMEDTLGDNDKLINEHGLSVLIETNKTKILFDTGQSGDFIKNADTLGKKIDDVDYVIISHAHYDHSGGFIRYNEEYPDNSYKLLIHKNFINPKYTKVDDNYIHKGNSFGNDYFKENSIDVKFIENDITCIADGIYILANFERTTNFEGLNSKFYIKNNDTYEVDSFNDEIMLAIDTDKGLVALLGCSHPGVINMLTTLQKRTNKKVYAVMGGTHLISADDTRIDETIAWLKDMDIKMIGTSHCTGERAMEKLGVTMKDAYYHNSVGTKVEFN